MATHSSILAWEIHGQRSLVDYSPWGCKESGKAELIHTHTQEIKISTVCPQSRLLRKMCERIITF